MGVELDRKESKRGEREAGGAEKALLLTRGDTAKEKARRRRSSTVREARPRTGRGGWEFQTLERGEGRLCHLVPRVPLNPLASPGGMVGILAPEAEKDGEEEVSHQESPPSQLNRTSSVTWTERER